MPDNVTTPPEGGGAPPPEPPKAPTAEDLQALQARLDQMAEENAAQRRALAERDERLEGLLMQGLPKQPDLDEPPELTPDLEGDARTEAIVKRAIHGVTKQVKAQLGSGTASLAALTRQQVLEPKPLYKRFKAEIDGVLKGLPLEQQANPAVLSKVYSVVVGEHSDELLEEVRQSERRAAVKPPAGGAAPGGGGATPRATDGEDLGELGLTKRQIDYIDQMGDAGVQRMTNGRYTTLKDYVAALKKMQGLKGMGVRTV